MNAVISANEIKPSTIRTVTDFHKNGRFLGCPFNTPLNTDTLEGSSRLPLERRTIQMQSFNSKKKQLPKRITVIENTEEHKRLQETTFYAKDN